MRSIIENKVVRFLWLTVCVCVCVYAHLQITETTHVVCKCADMLTTTTEVKNISLDMQTPTSYVQLALKRKQLARDLA